MEDKQSDTADMKSAFLLAFAPQIQENVRNLTKSAAVRSALVVLAGRDEDEVSTADFVTRVGAAGVGRTEAYLALAQLEQFGVIVRRRRGVIALTPASRPFLPSPTRAESAGPGVRRRRAVANGRNGGHRGAPVAAKGGDD